jgi:hypothetical protein
MHFYSRDEFIQKVASESKCRCIRRQGVEMKRIVTRMPESMYRKFKRIVDRADISFKALVNNILELGIERMGTS